MNLLSLTDSLPDPWNPTFLRLSVVLSVIVSTIIATRSGAEITGAFYALAVIIPALEGALRLDKVARRLPDAPRNSGKAVGYGLIAVSFVFAGIRLLIIEATPLAWAGALLPIILIATLATSLTRPPAIRSIIASLLLGTPIIMTAVMVGNPSSGGFPAVLIFLFSYIVFTTRGMEVQVRAEHADASELPVHVIFRKRLAWLSVVLFVFGVIAFWPWLGKLDGFGYFWILIIGVVAPLLFFWGRLRQPRREHSMPALVRFDRLLPYVGLMLLLAFAVG